MKSVILLSLFLIYTGIGAAQTLPKIASGKIQRIENFKSEFVASRNIDIWMPDGYDTSKKYNVVYMHDGQMLFDSTQTWNRKEWKADETFSQLIKDKKIEKCIIVAIWNTGSDRFSEYLPNKIFNSLEEKTKQKLKEKYGNGKPANGDNYLKFLVTELKPYIDKNFSTFQDKDHTFMVGSSMGGLISLYAICEYPLIFSGTACMSSALLSHIEPNYEIPAAIFNYLKTNLASPFGHKIYMDYGTGESDKNYELTQSFIDLIAKGKGYNDYNYNSKVFEKAEHNEIAWSQRLDVPLLFLMPKVKSQGAVSGSVDFIESFSSAFVSDRNVEVWLPDGYSPKKKYSVLYMHDGQMLYDPSTTWTGSSWNIDDELTKLSKEGKITDVIVVGIWNSGGARHADYFPQKPFESLSQEQKDFVTKKLQETARATDTFKPVSDNYLKFIVSELKPFIDNKYSVYKDKKHTFIAGSSMGGLISIYAICEYPEIFGGAACLSTHWPGIFSMEGNPVPDTFVQYLTSHLPDPKSHKIYFDYGDKTLDALYPPLQKRVDELMKEKGFTDKNWTTRFFEGDDHSEKSWNRRLHIPMEFLFKK